MPTVIEVIKKSSGRKPYFAGALQAATANLSAQIKCDALFVDLDEETRLLLLAQVLAFKAHKTLRESPESVKPETVEARRSAAKSRAPYKAKRYPSKPPVPTSKRYVDSSRTLLGIRASSTGKSARISLPADRTRAFYVEFRRVLPWLMGANQAQLTKNLTEGLKLAVQDMTVVGLAALAVGKRKRAAIARLQKKLGGV